MPHAYSDDPAAHGAGGSIRLAFLLNLAFTIAEFLGGWWTNSVAITADALHDLGDSVSLGLAWVLERVAGREASARFSYGYRRFSLLGALLNTVVLLVGSLLVLSEAVPRMLRPEHTDAEGMLAFALVGVAVNGAAVFKLRGTDSLNARVVAWHLLEDVLGWVAVLIVSVVLLFKDIPILDPLLSVLITLYVLYNVAGNLKTTLSLFLQAVPEGVDARRVEADLRAIEGVRSVHHLHIWSLDGEDHVLSAHLVVEPEVDRQHNRRIRAQARAVAGALATAHATIELEPAGEACETCDSA